MGRQRHRISVTIGIEPDEHPAEGVVWDLLVTRIQQVAAELAADPRLTGNPRLQSLADQLTYAVEIDDGYEVEGAPRIDPKALDIREGQRAIFNRSTTDRYGIPVAHSTLLGIVADEPRNGEHGITVEIRAHGATYYAPLDAVGPGTDQ